MNEHIKVGRESIDRVIEGVNVLADVVSQTLGPKGKNVLLDKSTGPEIINDGVTIARHVFLDDRLQNMGASLMKQISMNTDKSVSDGTTTSTVLGRALINYGYSQLRLKNLNTIELKKWLNYYKDSVIDYLVKQSREVNEENLYHVCMISSNNDSDLANLIVSAYKEVGLGGYMHVVHPKSVIPSYKVTKGLVYDRGWLSKMFKTSRNENAFLGYDAKVCYVDGEMRDLTQFICILEAGLSDGKNSPIIVIADKFTEEVVGLALENKLNGVPVCLLNSPGLVEEQMDYLSDLVSYTGGFIFNQKAGRNLYDIKDEDFGRVDYVKITDKDFEFRIDNPDLDKVNERIAELNKLIEESNSEMFTNLYRVRLSKLQTGIAVIYPGGQTDVEIMDNIERAKDAVGSLQAAAEKGVLPGGGRALMGAAINLVKNKKNEESKVAYEIIYKSLFVPIETILFNCGYDSDKVEHVINEIYNSSFWTGFNARNEEIEDFYESGVLDPLSVTISALENAVSVASSVLNMGASITLRQVDFEQGKTPLMELR